VFVLFRPNALMDLVAEPYRTVPAIEWSKVVDAIPNEGRLMVNIAGMTIEGDDASKALAVQLGPPAEPRKRLSDAGLMLVPLGDKLQVASVRFGSAAQKAGFEQGWDVVELIVPADRPNPHWFFLPALLLIGLVWLLQGRRETRSAAASVRPA
jgi:hypothetical protein